VRAMRMDSSEHKSVELSEEDIAVALDEYEVSCEFPLLLFAPTALSHHYSSLASRPLAGTCHSCPSTPCHRHQLSSHSTSALAVIVI
jgi:hypothetical protein